MWFKKMFGFIFRLASSRLVAETTGKALLTEIIQKRKRMSIIAK
jgi:hypothetical protein